MMKGKGRENGFPAIICQGMYMKYAIKVNEVKKENGNVKGFATVVFGDSFKITNIAIVENKDKGQQSQDKDGFMKASGEPLPFR